MSSLDALEEKLTELAAHLKAAGGEYLEHLTLEVKEAFSAVITEVKDAVSRIEARHEEDDAHLLSLANATVTEQHEDEEHHDG